MVLFFTTSELADMRLTMTSALDTTCTIQRLSGTSYVTTSTTTCLVLPSKSTVTYTGLPSILALQGWTLTLPWNADVRPGDRIVTPAATYYVQRVEQPSSYNVSSVAHCYQLFDGNGDSVFLPDRCSILRASRSSDVMGGQTLTWGTLSSSVPCLIIPETTQPQEVINQERLEAQSRWNIYLPIGQDVTIRDRISFQGATYEVSNVDVPRSAEAMRLAHAILVSS